MLIMRRRGGGRGLSQGEVACALLGSVVLMVLLAAGLFVVLQRI